MTIPRKIGTVQIIDHQQMNDTRIRFRVDRLLENPSSMCKSAEKKGFDLRMAGHEDGYGFYMECEVIE